jgi:isopentenyldiphosphate isomerase
MVRERQKSSRSNLLQFVTIVVLVAIVVVYTSGESLAHPLVQTYIIKDTVKVESLGLKVKSLGLIRPADYSPDIAMEIQAVHEGGHAHGGMWLNIISSDGKLLLLKRGRALKTCPKSWGLVGEHETLSEGLGDAMARRAIREELGSFVESLIVKSSNITESPVLYHKNEGDGRVDRQITALWCVHLNRPSASVRLHVDEEVADYKWLAPKEASYWLLHNPEDFCSPIVASLMELNLERLEQYLGGLA